MKNVNSRGIAAAAFQVLILAALALVLSVGLLRGSGLSGSLLQVISFALLLYFSSEAPRFRNWLMMPVAVLMALYFPVGFIYGIPAAGQIASLFATDVLESKEFLQTIPLHYGLAPLALIAGLWLFYRLQGRWKLTLRSAGSKGFRIIGLAILVASLVFAWASEDFHPLTRGFKHFRAVLIMNHQLKHLDRRPLWTISAVRPRHRISVLVIDESVRRDYMHAYGYPVENTPFMESVPGWIYEGLEAAGDNTVPSLKKALTYTGSSGKDVEYRMNLVDLAKDAGYSTAWFSNQGTASKFDTPVTTIASGAEQKAWLKYGRNSNYNFMDFELLPLVEKELARKDSRPKLIVVHLQGSHPLICSRLKDKSRLLAPEKSYYSEVACYIETIRQSDQILEKIRGMLANTGETFSILYFADHGLSHNAVDGVLTVKHAPALGNARDVPLFMTSSEDRESVRMKGRRYGKNLTEGVMAWLGIETEQVPHPRSLFRNEDDPADEAFEAMIASRPKDPAIDLIAFLQAQEKP